MSKSNIRLAREVVAYMNKLDSGLDQVDKALNQPVPKEDPEVITWWSKVYSYYSGDYKFVGNK